MVEKSPVFMLTLWGEKDNVLHVYIDCGRRVVIKTPEGEEEGRLEGGGSPYRVRVVVDGNIVAVTSLGTYGISHGLRREFKSAIRPVSFQIGIPKGKQTYLGLIRIVGL